ncbi:MAG: 50S ribosomal protein L22 [Deltaproteobacteria bacterium]|nr:50S ribosomal protein L22 [Deltaproteobacteria bacterium]
MEAKAIHRFARIAPRKVRYVADLIRGKDLNDALAILHFSPRAGAKVMGKVVLSALANAEHGGKVAVDNLYVKDVHVDEGPTMRRFRPRAMGRAYRIRKRTCHIHVVLDDERD